MKKVSFYGKNVEMKWIYLSPHLDDVALSCGGVIWTQQPADQVSIWTVCAGDPPDGEFSDFARHLHARWQGGDQAMSMRRAEDAGACHVLGASYRHLAVLDCIYRRSPVDQSFLYNSEEHLFVELHPDEYPLVMQWSQKLAKEIPAEAAVVCPLALGHHVDHQLTRHIAEGINRPLWFYADYPYVAQQKDDAWQVNTLGLEPVVFPVDEEALGKWQEAVAAHVSQISTFWGDLDTMRNALRRYRDQNGGVILWRNHCDS